MVGVESGRSLVRLVPDAELLVLERAGHVPTMTRPNDMVAAIGHRFPLAVGQGPGLVPS